MIYYEDDIVAEVRRNREELLEDHGGIEGYLKYLKEQRPKLEMQGWKIKTPKKTLAGEKHTETRV
jgi:hypothetical protein